MVTATAKAARALKAKAAAEKAARLEQGKARRYNVALIGPKGGIVRTSGTRLSLSEAESRRDSYLRAPAPDGTPVIRLAREHVRVFAAGIMEAGRVREIAKEHLSLAEAAAFCHAYNEGTFLHGSVAIILPPGTARTIRGARAKAK
jgi:hypothetical protein